jgi:hypothetical protein
MAFNERYIVRHAVFTVRVTVKWRKYNMIKPQATDGYVRCPKQPQCISRKSANLSSRKCLSCQSCLGSLHRTLNNLAHKCPFVPKWRMVSERDPATEELMKKEPQSNPAATFNHCRAHFSQGSVPKILRRS